MLNRIWVSTAATFAISVTLLIAGGKLVVDGFSSGTSPIIALSGVVTLGAGLLFVNLMRGNLERHSHEVSRE